MKLRISAALAALFIAFYTPISYADDATRARVVEALSAYESVPSQADWEKMGDVGPELLALSQDTAGSPSVRSRATHALGYFPTDSHRDWLVSVLSDTGARSGLRRSACYALANGWDDEALPLIRPALVAEDKQLRNAAARAVGGIGSPAARAVLEERLATEADPMVLSTLKSLLGR